MKNVKFVEKIVTIEDKGKTEEKSEFYKDPSGRIWNPGEDAIVTDKHAVWLSHHKFIETVKKQTAKKEDKGAKLRETK